MGDVGYHLAKELSNESHDIIAIDNNHNIVLWNKTAELMFGYTADEAVGKEILDPSPPFGSP